MESNTVFYMENYSIYAELIRNKKMVIDVKSITIQNYNIHYNSILNIMKDTIETEYMRNVFITLDFGNNRTCDLSISDYWMNLILWYLIVKTGRTIEPKHIFFETSITRGNIKNYVDDFFVNIYRTSIPSIDLNNIIDDCLYRFIHIDEFSMFLANTINLEDTIDLMNRDPEFYNLLHLNISKDTPLSEVKKVGEDATNRAVQIIKQHSEHSLANFFRANEGVNKKQFKEFAINIGTKPDGRGGVYPIIVNSNFITGGVNDLLTYFIESNSGRIAQIIVDNNVGDSGYFARQLGLNNTDSFLHEDSHYDCGTKNWQKLYIKDDNLLYKLENRYYRLSPNGMEYKIERKDRYLVGKTILLRSPMTCASAAEGNGICYKCYGDLAHINKDLNTVGKLAAELFSSVLTQMMLSAKHLLESSVKEMAWSVEFTDFFDVDFNIIKPRADVDFSGYKLVINTSDIDMTNEDSEEEEINEYVKQFYVINPEGNRIAVYTSEMDKLFITIGLNECIREIGKKYGEDEISIELEELKRREVSLFVVQIYNNDLNRILEKVQTTINSKAITEELDKDQLLQELLNNLEEGNLNLTSVHAEVILSNQIRSLEDILEKPDWRNPNEPYKIRTLKGSLKENPSITVSLAFEGIKRALYNPLTFRKYKPSFLDLFFMEQPQMYLSNTEEIKKVQAGDKDTKGMTIAMRRVSKEE